MADMYPHANGAQFNVNTLGSQYEPMPTPMPHPQPILMKEMIGG